MIIWIIVATLLLFLLGFMACRWHLTQERNTSFAAFVDRCPVCGKQYGNLHTFEIRRKGNGTIVFEHVLLGTFQGHKTVEVKCEKSFTD